MGGFCVSCGAEVPEGHSFCVSCGCRIAGVPFDEGPRITGACPRCASVFESDAKFCVNCGAPVEQCVSTSQPSSPILPESAKYVALPKNSHTGSKVALAVVASLFVVGVAIAVMPSIALWLQGKSPLELGSMSATIDASSSTDGKIVRREDSARTSPPSVDRIEEERHDRLAELYGQLDDFDLRVQEVAADFDNQYLSSSFEIRKSGYDAADQLNDDIVAASEETLALDIPSSSKYYDAWGDVCTLYECLLHRIGVICEAWQLDMQYSNPSEKKSDILALLEADQDASGSNRYFNTYQRLYPTVNLEPG